MQAGRELATASLLIIMIVAGCRESTAPRKETCATSMLEADEAIVTFAWRSRPDSMNVLVRGNATVRAACAYVAGESRANIPSGQIVRGPAPSDPDLPFHYIPESVSLVEVTIELCDSALLKTEEMVEEYFEGTGNATAESAPYCPWSAEPVRVR
jgi:hypothetical protein